MAFFGLTSSSSKKKAQRENKRLKQQLAAPKEPEPTTQGIREMALPIAEQIHQTEEKGRKEGQARGEEFHARQFQGLTPQQKQQEQAYANRRINREVLRNQRELIGKQGHHGIKGGSAYAQKADLERLGHEARNESENDIRKMDEALAMKKMASQFAIEEGGAAGRLLNEKDAIDQINLENERKRQRRLENQFNLIRG